MYPHKFGFPASPDSLTRFYSSLIHTLPHAVQSLNLFELLDRLAVGENPGPYPHTPISFLLYLASGNIDTAILHVCHIKNKNKKYIACLSLFFIFFVVPFLYFICYFSDLNKIYMFDGICSIFI